MDEWLQERDAILDELKFNLVKAQQRMKSAADTKRRDEAFDIGNWVYLKLQPYRQQTLARRPNEKLSPRFYGPYEIVQKIGEVAYKLALPPASKIHPVFHVSQLKWHIGITPMFTSIPSQLTEDLEMLMEPDQLLDIRQV